MASISLLFGFDRFMSRMRSLTNLIGNAVATIVIARWENELDAERAHEVLKGELKVNAGAEAVAEPAFK